MPPQPPQPFSSMPVAPAVWVRAAPGAPAAAFGAPEAQAVRGRRNAPPTAPGECCSPQRACPPPPHATSSTRQPLSSCPPCLQCTPIDSNMGTRDCTLPWAFFYERGLEAPLLAQALAGVLGAVPCLAGRCVGVGRGAARQRCNVAGLPAAATTHSARLPLTTRPGGTRCCCCGNDAGSSASRRPVAACPPAPGRGRTAGSWS